MLTRRQKIIATAAILVIFVGPGVVESLFGRAAGTATGVVVYGSLVVGVSGAGLAGALYGITALRLGFGLRTQGPDTTIDIGDGNQVYLEGTAKPYEHTVSGPFTGEECLAYTYAIEYRDTRTEADRMSEDHMEGRTETVWHDVVDDREVVPFELATGGGGGTVLVREEDLTPLLDDDETTIVVGPDETPPDRVQAFLDDPSVAAPNGEQPDIPSYDRDRTIRYREVLLLPGEECFVMGEGTSSYAADLDPEANVDAVVGPPERDGYLAWITDRLPREVYPFDFIVADTRWTRPCGACGGAA